MGQGYLRSDTRRPERQNEARHETMDRLCKCSTFTSVTIYAASVKDIFHRYAYTGSSSLSTILAVVDSAFVPRIEQVVECWLELRDNIEAGNEF